MDVTCTSTWLILCVPFVAKKIQGTGLRIRVDDELRDSFVQACKSKDLSAAQVLRHYMREFVETNTNDRQSELFSEKN